MSDPSSEHQQTAIRPSTPPKDDASAAFAIAVIRGADTGSRLEIDATTPSPVLIGQSPACALQLTDRLVSRRHLAVRVDGLALRVVDAGSTNGSFVDGLRFFDIALVGGEHLRLGDTELVIERVHDRAAPTLATAARFGRFIGHSREVRKLFPIFERLAKAQVPLIIEGETGTGKEVLAESLHELGPRSARPFVVFDCTAVPATLMESALFGHERGAFTGATATRKGVFEQADGGTLLLDEIGDLELSLQPKLLRAIERSEIQRVGGERWIKVDVRVLSATRRDLDQAVALGAFRDDLFFRLAVARIELPPLRRRDGDVGALARHFWRALEEHAGEDRALPASFLARNQGYAWPGNVRELANAIAREHALGDLDGAGALPLEEPEVVADDDVIARVLSLDLPLIAARERVVAAFERRYVAAIVEKHGGNVSRAAAASGLARRYFQLLRSKHGK